MPQSEMPYPDPEMIAELDVIDATLRGEPVDPAYAELAEITVLLAAQRPPAPRPEFTRALDARAARRFAPVPSAAAAGNYAGAPRKPRAGSRLASALAQPLRRPALGAGLAAGLALALAVVIVLPGSSSNSSTPLIKAPPVGISPPTAGASGSASGRGTAESVTSGSASGGGTAEHATGLSSGRSTSSSAAGSTGSYVSPHGLSKAGSAGGLGTLGAPPAAESPGRKVVQSAQIQLGTANRRIDTVSQEVFNVVSAENGIVVRSSVTAASRQAGSSFASFALSIPTANLQSTMTRLSSLRYASVISREQATDDVTDQYNDDKRALADAQALRISLLKQLQNAVTTAAIDSLTAQIHSQEAVIKADETRLNRLQHSIGYTTVDVQINAQTVFPAGTRHSHSFTIGRGAHDALRVLVVAAGLVLIVLAAMVPLGLIAALLTWIGLTLRQRRREHALDQG